MDELKRRGWTQDDLAKILGKPQSRINELVHGKLAISAELATALGAAFGTTAEYWMHADAAARLAQTASTAEQVRRRARLYELAPVKEMQKRGWIGPAEAADDLERDLLRFYRIASPDEEPSIHGAMRKTAPAVAATPAQKAWAFRVRQVAAAIPAASVAKYSRSKIDACRQALRKLASYSAGLSKVPGVLLGYGIRFVVVEGLPGAKMDGFATWLDPDSPVIGVTLRYDRFDSFWHTLGHELTHIKYEDVAPIDGELDDVDEMLKVKPPMERRADQESCETFVPADELDSFIRRVGPLYSTEKINQFANRIKMHPSIIIGQLKHRGEIGPKAHNKNTVPVRDALLSAAVTDGWGKSIDPGVIP